MTRFIKSDSELRRYSSRPLFPSLPVALRGPICVIRNRKTFSIFLIAYAAICLAQTQARGDLVITVGNATLTSGGTGFVDVMITGGLSDRLGRFGYEFLIGGAIAANGDLQFAAMQLSTEQNSPKYVFFNNTDPDSFTAVRGSGGADPLALVGGDIVGPAPPMVPLDDVPIHGTFLLARLELQHVGPFLGPSHDFTIVLNKTSLLTEFDKDFDSGTMNNYDKMTQVTALAGTITVNAAAVPEPTSTVFLLLVCIGGIAVRRRCR